MFGIAVAQYIYYYWYEAVKKYIQDTWAKGRVLSITENMLTGAVAGNRLSTHEYSPMFLILPYLA